MADSAKVFDHITRPVREDDRIIFSAMDSSTSYSEIDEAVTALNRVSEGSDAGSRKSLKRYRDDIFDDKYKRLDWNQVSRTITAHIAKDGYWYIHPEQDRTLTIREAARIQTFPDQVRFSGPPSAAFRQIGNAVPPRLGELVGRKIACAMDAPTPGPLSTIVLARRLAAWFEIKEAEGLLRFPWLASDSLATSRSKEQVRWLVIQAELLLAKTNEQISKTLWPIVEKLDSPRATLCAADQVAEMAGWVGRVPQAEKVLEAATYVDLNPDSLGSVSGMCSVPHVGETVAVLASRVAPNTEEDPVLANSGILRVAARHSGTQVDRKRARTDGRIELARLIGAEDETSDHAFLALIELAETCCTTGTPECQECPLSASCSWFSTSMGSEAE